MRRVRGLVSAAAPPSRRHRAVLLVLLLVVHLVLAHQPAVVGLLPQTCQRQATDHALTVAKPGVVDRINNIFNS